MTGERLAERELAELVTAYLEGTLSRRERARFEAHLAGCEACANYIAQMRATIAAAGRITQESIDPEARDALLGAFRDWKAAR